MPNRLLAAAWGLGLCASGLAISVSGCTSSAPPATPAQMQLKELATYYSQYTGVHQGRGPKNEADFKAFIQQRAGSMSSEQIDALFISPRDQKPYVIAYNVRLGAMPQTAPPVVAHEEIGVEGRRFAADVLGGVEEIDEAGLQKRSLTRK